MGLCGWAQHAQQPGAEGRSSCEVKQKSRGMTEQGDSMKKLDILPGNQMGPWSTEILINVTLYSLEAESWEKPGTKATPFPQSPSQSPCAHHLRFPDPRTSVTSSDNSTFSSITRVSPLVNSLSLELLHCLLADLSEFSFTPFQVLVFCRVLQTFFYFAPQIYLHLCTT